MEFDDAVDRALGTVDRVYRVERDFTRGARRVNRTLGLVLGVMIVGLVFLVFVFVIATARSDKQKTNANGPAAAAGVTGGGCGCGAGPQTRLGGRHFPHTNHGKTLDLNETKHTLHG